MTQNVIPFPKVEEIEDKYAEMEAAYLNNRLNFTDEQINELLQIVGKHLDMSKISTIEVPDNEE